MIELERLEQKCMEQERTIDKLRMEIKRLKKQLTADSWKGEVDRMSGAFSPEEIQRLKNGGW